MRRFWFIVAILSLVASVFGAYAYDAYFAYDRYFADDAYVASHAGPKWTEPSEDVDFEEKAAVLTFFLSGIRKEDHAVTDDDRIYLLVSEGLYAKLPRTTNGIKVELYTGPTEVHANTVPYIVFSSWAKRADTVFVTQTAYFVGGNSGGCKEQYKFWEVSGWKRTSADCFAAAS